MRLTIKLDEIYNYFSEVKLYRAHESIRFFSTGREKMAAQPQTGSIEVPIEWYVPEGLPVLWANHLIIQHTEQGEFIINFFQLPPPLILQASLKEIAKLENVRATAVARLSVSPAQMESMLNAMITNYNTFRQKETTKKVEKGEI